MSKRNSSYTSHKYALFTGEDHMNSRTFNFAILPLIVALAIVPLITYVYIHPNTLYFLPYMAGEPDDAVFDIFLYYKGVFLIAAAVIMCILIICKLLSDGRKIKISLLYIPVAVYAVFALLSAFFSDYTYVYSGIDEHFESIWVVLAYVIVAYYAFLCINTHKDIDVLLICFGVTNVLMITLGLFQGLGGDLLQYDFVQHLLIPKQLIEYDPDFRLALDFESQTFLTLYNPNYVGTYVTLSAPIFLLVPAALADRDMPRRRRLLLSGASIVIFVGLILCLLLSQSRAGLAGSAVSAFLLVAIVIIRMLRGRVQKKSAIFIYAGVALATVAGIILIYNAATDGFLKNRVDSAVSSASSTFASKIEWIETSPKDHNDIRIHYDGSNYYLGFAFNEDNSSVNFSFYDEDDTPVAYEKQSGSKYLITDSRFVDASFRISRFTEDLYGISCNLDGRDYDFVHNSDGTYSCVNRQAKLQPLAPSAEWTWLKQYAGFASRRGYIWAKTVPLLKSTVILGTGPDTFLFYFPNTDIVDKANYGYEGMRIDKPHNMYLQIGVQTGLISLLAFLIAYLIYFIDCLKVLLSVKKAGYCFYIALAIFAATFGYMFVQLINDSLVGITQIFTAFIGMGLALNRLVLRSDAEVSLKNK